MSFMLNIIYTRGVQLLGRLGHIYGVEVVVGPTYFNNTQCFIFSE